MTSPYLLPVLDGDGVEVVEEVDACADDSVERTRENEREWTRWVVWRIRERERAIRYEGMPRRRLPPLANVTVGRGG